MTRRAQRVKVMFLDESGDHRLHRISPTYPIFVLGGVIVERSYLRQVVEPTVRALKRRFWGREDVVLHSVDMRNNAGDFAFLTDPERRAEFYDALNAMLMELDYSVVAVVVRKREYLARHGPGAPDPYLHAFGALIERFCSELADDPDGGFVCAERRGATLDRELLEAWSRMREDGAGATPAMHIEDRIVGLDLRPKRPHLAGMQIADLVITPPGRYVLGSPAKRDQVRWSVVEPKLLKSGKGYSGTGLVVFT